MAADLDPQKQRIGRETTGEAGGAYAVGQHCRQASPVRELNSAFAWCGQVVTGVVAAQQQRSGSEKLTE